MAMGIMIIKGMMITVIVDLFYMISVLLSSTERKQTQAKAQWFEGCGHRKAWSERCLVRTRPCHKEASP